MFSYQKLSHCVENDLHKSEYIIKFGNEETALVKINQYVEVPKKVRGTKFNNNSSIITTGRVYYTSNDFTTKVFELTVSPARNQKGCSYKNGIKALLFKVMLSVCKSKLNFWFKNHNALLQSQSSFYLNL